jgi:hypothetical protein
MTLGVFNPPAGGGSSKSDGPTEMVIVSPSGAG